MSTARHALVVIGGATLIWTAYHAIGAMLRLIPGYAGQVHDWFMLHPDPPAVTAFVLYLILAAAVSTIQEVRHPRGVTASIWAGVAFGLLTFDSRFSSMPAHLRDVTALIALCKAAILVVAGIAMLVAKKRWIREDGAVPPMPANKLTSSG